MNVTIQNKEGVEFLTELADTSVDLILTDPPYLISKESGMNTFAKEAKQIEASGKNKKTEEEWEEIKHAKGYTDDKYKKKYIKYGNTSGKKYGYKTSYGDWDTESFAPEKLQEFVKLFYQKLKPGGTCIIFFDMWKMETLKRLMEQIKPTKKGNWVGFKQIRLIEWIKTNPIPLNQSTNYLSNVRECALLGVKGGCPTFNSKYDKGIYYFPIQSGKNRFHPTQKSLQLFEALIKKHSHEGDVVVDPFLGGGTTAIACRNTKRDFKGCEINTSYYDKVMKILS